MSRRIDPDSWLWKAPEYFSRWRLFPRAFISMYIYMLYHTTQWFMMLDDPTNAQAGFVSVIVGAGAAWFGLYVNSGQTAEPPRIYVKNDTVTRNNTGEKSKPSYGGYDYADGSHYGDSGSSTSFGAEYEEEYEGKG